MQSKPLFHTEKLEKCPFLAFENWLITTVCSQNPFLETVCKELPSWRSNFNIIGPNAVLASDSCSSVKEYILNLYHRECHQSSEEFSSMLLPYQEYKGSSEYRISPGGNNITSWNTNNQYVVGHFGSHFFDGCTNRYW